MRSRIYGNEVKGKREKRDNRKEGKQNLVEELKREKERMRKSGVRKRMRDKREDNSLLRKMFNREIKF